LRKARQVIRTVLARLGIWIGGYVAISDHLWFQVGAAVKIWERALKLNDMLDTIITSVDRIIPLGHNVITIYT
jgi:hypothetical protein